MKKTISVALTNRTNYSKLKTVLLELREYSDIECYIVLSSSILLERYGSSYTDLLDDGLTIDKKIDCVLMNDCHEAMAKTIGLSVVEHATYFGWRKPDLLLIVGDRFDMMAPVISAATMNIPIAHIQGGETSGTIDNVVRDILTRFSKLHFVATEKSAENLLSYGIEPKNIFSYGCPAVEYISEMPVGDYFDPKRITKKFKRSIEIERNEKYFVVMAHPDTTNHLDIDMSKVLDVVESFGLKAFVFYPNIDANNSEIVSGITAHNKNPNFYTIRHMPLEDFVHVLAHCVCMIGNSSAGIREAASFGIPVINIGNRQIGRERNPNVVDIGEDYELLRSSIAHSIDNSYKGDNLYYVPGCSQKIAATIAGILTKSEIDAEIDAEAGVEVFTN